MIYKIIAIDLQKDFTDKSGICYKPRPAVTFIKNILLPYLEKNNLKVAEIISDYRQPRPGDSGDCCHPGETGCESEIPKAVKEKSVWIKCMNSPLWIRKNIGNKNKKPGPPYQDPKKFDAWLKKVIGQPKDTGIVLIGLTLDCCVLCAAQELCFRGYSINILEEATDTNSGKRTDKSIIFKSPINNWAKPIKWKVLKALINN